MMYLIFENSQTKKIAEARDRATIGSAASNAIVLDSPTMRPVHAQLQWSDQGLELLHLSDWRRVLLHESKSLQLEDWTVNVLSLNQMLSQFQNEILASFRDILRENPEEDVQSSVEALGRRWFCGSIPSQIESLIRAQVSEIYLDGPIESLLVDDEITDILVEAWNCIYIEKAGELCKSSYGFTSQDAYELYLENLLKKAHQSLDDAHAYLDFKLVDGSRAHLIAPPLTAGPKYLSIRRPRREAWTLELLQDSEMFEPHVFQKLHSAIENRWNVLISGKTGSGKTSLLQAMLHSIDVRERIIVIEDTPELSFNRENAAFLKTHSSLGMRTTLRDLVKQSLRMRPDRIVVGEVRGEEALDLLHAMNTGHRGCLGSLHANSCRDALYRLQGLIQMADASLSERVTRDLISRNIHWVVHCDRLSSGKRFLKEMAFVRGIDGDQILMEVHSNEITN